jgi:hypothetical protein
LFRFAKDEVDGLDRLGIVPLLLKGIPLAHQYYASPGLRPMSDVDLLVRPGQAIQAIKSYVDRGWSSSDDFIVSLDDLEAIVAVRNGVNMRDPASGREIDLHWSLLKNSLVEMEGVFAASKEFELQGRTMGTLCPTDQLLHAFAQAADWNVVRPIRWMPDAKMILSRAHIDWERLVQQAGTMEIVDVARDALLVLKEFLGTDIPQKPIDQLKKRGTTLLMRLDYKTSARAPLALIGRPLIRYLRYRRVGRPQGLRFDQYLKYMWGTRSLLGAVRHGWRLFWAEALRGKMKSR